MMMTRTTTRPIRVFLVDDHKTTLWGLQRLIEGAAPRMQLAGTACCRSEMLARVPPAKPDVVVMDIDLGGDNALDALPDLLRETSTQVLVLTGIRNQNTHEKAILCGARGVVQKEMSAETLLQAIDKVFAGEIWLDRILMGKVLGSLTDPRWRQKVSPESLSIASLTQREVEIIGSVVKNKGAKNKVIAGHLHISEHTLRNHLSVIYEKLGVNGRLELFLFATDHGIGRETAAECHQEW